MTAVTQCKECGGTGKVEFTKERGGPRCNNCGGEGYMTMKVVRPAIASILDNPSVYMGGPSHGSLRKADAIIEYLVDQGIFSSKEIP